MLILVNNDQRLEEDRLVQVSELQIIVQLNP